MGMNDGTKFQSPMDQPWVIEIQYCQSPMVGQSPMDQPWVIGRTEIQFWNVKERLEFIKNNYDCLSFWQK